MLSEFMEEQQITVSSSSLSRSPPASVLQAHRIRDRFILADKIYCSLLVGVLHLKMRPMNRGRRCRARQTRRHTQMRQWESEKEEEESPFCRVVTGYNLLRKSHAASQGAGGILFRWPNSADRDIDVFSLFFFPKLNR